MVLSFGLTYYVCIFAELLFPTYASLKAIQSPGKLDDTQWLTYWVVYAFISTFESVGAIVLQWIPLYYEIKLLFVLWMIAPQTQGARKIYEDHIMPLLKKYGDKIDPIFARAESALESQYVNHLAKYVDKHGPAILEQAAAQAQKHGTVVAGMAQAAYQEQLKKAGSSQPGGSFSVPAAPVSGAH
ncbi:hypothetical protein HXX76_002758 [Chlamydomonas incerta]|uniref:HVA22-like protein n=1 Tax=Chlamydomonas incerta TaxID=51695 RepID=A0A835W7U0_CHLIN|nr:hypothetical protein HXX76_002758 [Chlamydomonas incerta]|eukprot:KAG2442675.1 hypothetical protein HXX76_002758 [Chlamydomonas incerta]